MATLDKVPSEDKDYLRIYMPEVDRAFLRQLATEAGVPMGLALHALFEMLLLTVGSAKESGLVDEDVQMPALELYTARVMHLLGLLTDVEFQRAVNVADAMEGKNISIRLRGLAQFCNERLAQLKPIWAAQRAMRETETPAPWEPAVATRLAAVGEPTHIH